MKESTRHHRTRTARPRKKEIPPFLVGYRKGGQQAKRVCPVCKEAVYSPLPQDETILIVHAACRDELWRYL